MPIYEFQCKSCGKIKESIVPADTKKITCRCGGTATKIISKTSFILKGSGWAQDGYANKKTN